MHFDLLFLSVVLRDCAACFYISALYPGCHVSYTGRVRVLANRNLSVFTLSSTYKNHGSPESFPHVYRIWCCALSVSGNNQDQVPSEARCLPVTFCTSSDYTHTANETG